MDVGPARAGEALDEAFHQSARRNLKEFKKVLKEGATRTSGEKRQPDSIRRNQVKRQRRKEKKTHSKDDAERDCNHAIAQELEAPRGEFLARMAAMSMFSVASEAKGASTTGENEVEVWNRTAPSEQEEFKWWMGAVFDVAWVLVLLLLVWGVLKLLRWLWGRFGFGRDQKPKGGKGGSSPGSSPSKSRQKTSGSILSRKERCLGRRRKLPSLGAPKLQRRGQSLCEY